MSGAILVSSETVPKAQESRVIEPIVERHVGDAAFYWSQLDRSTHSPLLNIDGVLHFEGRLTAHLDGIVVAEESGWQVAMKALYRWRSAGEMFVCAMLTFSTSDRSLQQQRWSSVLAILQSDPHRKLRGVVAALLRIRPEIANGWITKFIQPHESAPLQVIAWRALARSRVLCHQFARQDLEKLLQQAMAGADAHVRAAACRAAGMAGFETKVQKLIQDNDRSAGVEAAIALAQQGQSQTGLHCLWSAVWAQIGDVDRLTGVYKSLAMHRLARWVRYLGVHVPNGHEQVPRVLEVLPARIALSFLLHHADDKYLDWIQTQMSNPQCARLAAWTWASLLGIDLERSGLALPVARSEESTHCPTDDLDPGLALPDVAAIQQFNVAENVATYGLSTRLKTVEGCRHILRQGPQALRWIAAQYLSSLGVKRALSAESVFDTKADARRQLQLMGVWTLPGSEAK
ncbi:hypothetical protein G7047_13230 [Diaphorobacter sp. HDW4A]|uniref:hypothetical protein n=1 Tax=Diaphorobacter sp. HDW4A TaxID=2714924 RepID=UPI00140BC1CF|nr:hypothetical protein [Diaphorobacter sp. HDW4A]QIL80758.1 hypothetical protein G7047_13230 [Diaphorobacter sp. HDW4A]